ncbi:MAG: AlpA family phage regulatory protein [Burkholderiaceae bacterium]|nr:AlpA family phage regulatory protein [Burkholderiaceae bacterium]
MPSVSEQTGLPSVGIYRQIRDGLFTRPVRLGLRAVGWPAAEVAELNVARIRGDSADQIRALVERLHEARKSGEAHHEL